MKHVSRYVCAPIATVKYVGSTDLSMGHGASGEKLHTE